MCDTKQRRCCHITYLARCQDPEYIIVLPQSRKHSTIIGQAYGTIGLVSQGQRTCKLGKTFEIPSLNRLVQIPPAPRLISLDSIEMAFARLLLLLPFVLLVSASPAPYSPAPCKANILVTNDDGWAVAQIRSEFDAIVAAGYNVCSDL